MTNKEYREHEGISKSSLWEINKSPLHFKYKMDNPREDTQALLFGRAIHKYILESDTFFNEFAICPQIDRRSKSGKEEYDNFIQLSNGKDIITQSDFDIILEMKKSIDSLTDVVELLKGDYEQSYFWTDQITGEKCKCRPDVINHKNKLIVDLKTTDSCEDNHFEWSCKKYGYKLQAGMYCEGIFQNTFDEYGFKFIAIEKKQPYAVRIYNCTPEYINQGYDKFRELLGIYHECKIKNEWKGYDRIEAREVDLLADDYID
ncbi:MAG: hypothetical protein BV456_03535 [Thermoplasmata archaeon M8B2D]|nr:MAG: hypothetical protein BV456_03535 [Thermoplasmata archaeon M8B2D]